MPHTSSSRFADWLGVIRRTHDAYHHYLGRRLHLLHPRRYTEKMQWRKLFDLDPRYAILSDKLAVRDVIAGCLGREYLVPLLWQGDDPDQIPFDDLTPPYVLKSTHACAHVIIVGEGQPVDRSAIRATARGWLGHCHGTLLDEPGYIHVPRRLIVERQIVPTADAPLFERKLFMFDGTVGVINTIWVDGNRTRRGAFHTADWERLPWAIERAPLEMPLPRPKPLDAMVDAASRLAAGYDHLRVDFYDDGERFWLGELTVYSYSGLAPVAPDAADYSLGAFWKLHKPASCALMTMLTRRWEIRAPAGVNACSSAGGHRVGHGPDVVASP